MEMTAKEYEYLAQVGRKIALLRAQQGLTQQQLADSADLDIAVLIQIEKGMIDIPLFYMYSIQKSLNINPEELYIDCN